MKIKYIGKIPEDDVGFHKVKIGNCKELNHYIDGVWKITKPVPLIENYIKNNKYKNRLSEICSKVVLKEKGKYYLLFGYGTSNYVYSSSLTLKEYNILKNLHGKFLNKKTIKRIAEYESMMIINKTILESKLEWYKFKKRNGD